MATVLIKYDRYSRGNASYKKYELGILHYSSRTEIAPDVTKHARIVSQSKNRGCK